jgi:hypothetical protein
MEATYYRRKGDLGIDEDTPEPHLPFFLKTVRSTRSKSARKVRVVLKDFLAYDDNPTNGK